MNSVTAPFIIPKAVAVLFPPIENNYLILLTK